MPNSVIKSLAKKSNRPVTSVEKTWNDTVDMQLKKMKEDDPKFYATVVTIVKKKLNIKEDDKTKDDKNNTETDNKVAGVRSITSKVVENFGNSLATSNVDYSNSSAGNGAYFGKVNTGKKVKKKKKKKPFVESGNYLLSSSVGSLKQEKPVQNLSEMETWTKRWEQLRL